MARRSANIFTLLAFLTGSVCRAELTSDHWSLSPLKRGVPPSVQMAGWCRTPVDQFILNRLDEQKIRPSLEADKRVLIRRAYFDLIGLPPLPDELAAFEQDDSPNAFEKLLDRLLASPQYGERWGRHWLDLVRFAQSNGYERDGEKLLAWRYRDYVIHAFNQDKPYNRFITEQIAGDELPDGTAESVVATAFQRLGVFDDEPDDKRMAEFDALDDVLSTTGTTFLGLTLGCARCHDHKFDPIPQSDYYSLLAFFRGISPFDSAAPSFDSPGFVPLGPPNEVNHWRACKNERLKALREQLAHADEQKKKRLEEEIAKIKQDVPYQWTLGVRESGPVPPPTFVLSRGNAASPTKEVHPAFLKAITAKSPDLNDSAPESPTSGRRQAFAKWVASPENPLTARVMVNRIWQHHFGEGLVKTTSDFGRAGSPPSHPELLDWLAAEFMESGWSVKHLHKLIMLSATYCQSSRADNEHAAGVDPGNRLLWRQNLRRLEAEAIRDSVLAVAGTLNPRMEGRGFFPHLSGEVIAGQSRPGLDWDNSNGAEKSRRSVYAYIRRTMGVPLFESFDYSNTTSPLPERPTTTVAPQALMLLNDAFMQQQADAFARRIREIAPEDRDAQIRAAYSLALNRVPSPFEIETARSFLDRHTVSSDALNSRITFQLDVANALSTDYFAKLAPSQFLLGPEEGWTFYRGSWAPPYEGIRVLLRDHGPFALWNGSTFSDGTIAADILLSNSSEFASILLRATAEADDARGYEIVLDPRKQRILLRRLTEKIETLAEVNAAIETGRAIPVKIELAGPQIRLWVAANADPTLDITDSKPFVNRGHLGVRASGGTVTLVNARLLDPVTTETKPVVSRKTVSSVRALESFCLLLLNLNETIYID